MSSIKSVHILGISCFYHDAAVALVKDGKLIAVAEEERFTRKKHDDSFPENAIKFCLKQAGIKASDLNFVGFYEKPFLKFERILETYLKNAPKGFSSFREAIPLWVKEKLWIKNIIKEKLQWDGEIIFLKHHLSHAASAFLVSPFKKAAIMTIDGVGEWETVTRGYGEENRIVLTDSIIFPHSLGLLYSAFTYYCGFRVNNGEFKVMGLASYGKPVFVDKIKKNLIEIKEDGSFRLNMNYFTYEHSLRMVGKKFCQLFGGLPPRKPGNGIPSKHYQNVAASLQKVTEEVILKQTQSLYQQTELSNLCLAGGVALNCVANGKILEKTPFKRIFIQPAAGDSGGALGTAFYIYNCLLNKKRVFKMNHAYYGPRYSNTQIRRFLNKKKINYKSFSNKRELLKTTASLIANEKIVAWFQGRMEWGPRALGTRSILADARNPKMKDILNKKVKHREPFRPFAPSVLEEKTKEYFEFSQVSPYMLLATQTKKGKKLIPAVTHIDGSSRIQTVNKKQNSLYYELIKEFYKQTGCPIIVNTSFNIRGEPIVCAPEDAYNCFANTGIDYLILGNFLINKKQ